MPCKGRLRINTWTAFISSNCRAKALTQLSTVSQPVNSRRRKNPQSPSFARLAAPSVGYRIPRCRAVGALQLKTMLLPGSALRGLQLSASPGSNDPVDLIGDIIPCIQNVSVRREVDIKAARLSHAVPRHAGKGSRTLSNKELSIGTYVWWEVRVAGRISHAQPGDAPIGSSPVHGQRGHTGGQGCIHGGPVRGPSARG